MSKMGDSGDQDYIDRIRMEALVADALRQADRDNERVVVRREEKSAHDVKHLAVIVAVSTAVASAVASVVVAVVLHLAR